MADLKFKNISRIENKFYSGCWFVRFYHIKIPGLTFYDSKYDNDKIKSLCAALKYRNKIAKKYKLTFERPKYIHHEKPYKTNTTGHLGVSINRQSCRSWKYKDRNYDLYVAQLVKGKTRLCKSFSMHKYGKNDALRLAIMARREMEKELWGDG